MMRCGEESHSRVEYILDGDIDATVLFSDGLVILDWESKTNSIGGIVHFMDVDENTDWDWVRSFCRSISVCQPSYESVGKEVQKSNDSPEPHAD